jgi:formyltetrahydrofolate-dependent phosphoribosylglycinamide formyltransferase
LESKEELLQFPRIAVLVSGSGTNLQAIIDDGIPIALVLADRPEIASIDRANAHGIKWSVVDRSQYKGQRETFTSKIVEELKSNSIEMVVLAGFMTIFTEELVHEFENKMLNIHPSLLPSFTGTYGKGTMTATLQAGVKVTGVTVHIVTQEVDAGPILSQESVEVLDSDDEDALHERIQKVEHRLYPQTIRQFCAENFNN